MAKTPLELAKQLIAHANDKAATEDEARTIAMKAAKIIFEHKLLGELYPPAAEPGMAGLRAERDMLKKRLEDLQTLLRSRFRVPAAAPAPAPVPFRRTPWAPSYARPGDPDTRATDPKHRVIIESKFPGRCAHCGEPYEVGDMIAWWKKRSVFHSDCYDEWLEESA
jgi:hypothetical protein